MQNSFYLRFLLVLALFLGVMEGYAQKEASNWSFHGDATLTPPFYTKRATIQLLNGNVDISSATGVPTPTELLTSCICDPRILTPISDINGNLLFYTSGGVERIGNGVSSTPFVFLPSVYASDGSRIPQAELIPFPTPFTSGARIDKTQNILSLPQPNSCRYHYIFSSYYVKNIATNNYYGLGLRYSIFDTQNNTLVQKNISLWEATLPSSVVPHQSIHGELDAALHQDNVSSWVVNAGDIHHNNMTTGFRFSSYLLSPSGIISNPVVSDTPLSKITSNTGVLPNKTVISPTSTMIAQLMQDITSPNPGRNLPTVILYNFDRTTGFATFQRTVNLPATAINEEIGSIAFSQQGNYIYITTLRNINSTSSSNTVSMQLYQLDATSTTSNMLLLSSYQFITTVDALRGHLKLTYNDRILFSVEESDNTTLTPLSFNLSSINGASTATPIVDWQGTNINPLVTRDIGEGNNFPNYYFSSTYSSPVYSHCLSMTTTIPTAPNIYCDNSVVRVHFKIEGQGAMQVSDNDIRVQFADNLGFNTTDVNNNVVSLNPTQQLLTNVAPPVRTTNTANLVEGYVDVLMPTPPFNYFTSYFLRAVSLNPYTIGNGVMVRKIEQSIYVTAPSNVCGGTNVPLQISPAAGAPLASGLYDLVISNNVTNTSTTISNVNFVNGYATVNYTLPIVSYNQQIIIQVVDFIDKNTPKVNACPKGQGVTFILAGSPLGATMSATSPVCRGSNASVTINFTGGAAPWTFTIPALSASPIVSYNNPYVATIPTSSLASNSVVYNMTALSSSSTANCGGVNLPSPVTLVVNEVPTATINCPNPLLSLTVNQSSTLPATFTGTAPFSYQTTVYAHKKNGSVQTSTLPTVANQPANVLLPVSITGVCNTHENNDIDYLEYEVKVTDATGCESIVSNKCRVNVNPIADLWAKDTDDDTGVEDGTLTGQEIWHSPDIWVRNSRDFGLDPQNPIANQVNYVYVRIRNRGQVAAAGKLSTFWTRPITSLQWHEHFTSTTWTECGTRLGGEIAWMNSMLAPRIKQGTVISNTGYGSFNPAYGAYDFPAVPAGDEIIIEIPWQVPNPTDYACSPFKTNHYCLYARIAQNPSNTCCADGIRFLENPNTCEEYDDAYLNAALNNNVIWRNLYLQGVGGLTGDNTSIIAISNPSSSPINIRLDFTTPANQQADSYFNYGKAFVDITHNNVYGTWTGGGQNVTNLPTQSLIELTNHTSSIYNLTLAPQQMAYLKVNFQWYNNPANGREFILSMKQSNVGVTPARVMGGQEFRIRADFGNPASNTCSDNGIVACYRFNGDATDGSGNNNHLSIGQGVSLTTDKQNTANSAYFFSGTGSYMTASSSSTLTSPTRTISLSGWFQAQSGSGQGWVPLISKGSQYKLLGYFNGSYLTALNFSGYYFSAQSAVGIAPILMPDGQGWYHITVTGDRYGINFYVNNQLVSTQEISYDTTTDEDNLMLGYSTGKTSISGKMDDIRIYNRVLTAAEISTIFTRQSSSSLGRVEKLVNTTDDIVLYPNPVKDILQVELTNLNAGQVDIIIYDMMGRKIHTQHVDKDENHLHFTINTTEFLSGLYMIEFNQNGNRTVKKFVKN